MGNKYEVSSWVFNEAYEGGAYEYQTVYRGESFLRMLHVAWQEKRKGVGCVKMEWRGKS